MCSFGKEHRLRVFFFPDQRQHGCTSFFFPFLCHKVSDAPESEGTLSRDLATQECVESQARPLFPAMPVRGALRLREDTSWVDCLRSPLKEKQRPPRSFHLWGRAATFQRQGQVKESRGQQSAPVASMDIGALGWVMMRTSGQGSHGRESTSRDVRKCPLGTPRWADSVGWHTDGCCGGC